jgi:hypothetical protein
VIRQPECLTVAILLLLPFAAFTQETILSEDSELHLDDELYGESRSIDWFTVTVPAERRLRAWAVSADFTPRLVFDGPEDSTEHAGERFVAEGATQFPGENACLSR